MATIIFDSESDHLTCFCCGNGWDEWDLVECDECGETICEDCVAVGDDDCPGDFCERCNGNKRIQG